ncbi:hypothetical protein ACFTZB_30385, partial [Rhodococcus sp. NPDC057014]
MLVAGVCDGGLVECLGELVEPVPSLFGRRLVRERVESVDIANTAVARGKIYLARNRGEEIPSTWAMDVAAMGSTTAYLDSVGELIDEVKNTALAEGA